MSFFSSSEAARRRDSRVEPSSEELVLAAIGAARASVVKPRPPRPPRPRTRKDAREEFANLLKAGKLFVVCVVVCAVFAVVFAVVVCTPRFKLPVAFALHLVLLIVVYNLRFPGVVY